MADITAQAQAGYGALQDQERKALAYNALNAAYGPAIAYSPENALNAASASANIPLAPQAAQANLANTQAEAPLKQAQMAQSQANTANLQNMNATTAGVRGARMLQAIANPDDSIPADEAAHVLSNPAYGLSPGEQQAYLAQMTKPGGKSVIDNIVSAMQAGGKVSGPATVITNPDGTTTIYRSTSTGGEVANNIGGGQTAQQQNAATNAKYAGFKAETGRIAATQPRGIVVTPTGAVATVGGGRTNVTPLTSIQGPQGTEAKAAANVVGKAQGTNEANALPQNVAIARTALGQADLQFGRAADAIDSATRLAGPLTTGLAGRVSEAVGTPARRALDAQISTIKSNVAIAVSQLARVDKNAPFAVRNLQEFKAIQDNLGALDPSASNFPDQLAKTKQSLSDLQGVLHDKYSATYGPGVLDHGVAPPGTMRTGRPNQPVDFRTYFSGSP